MAIRSSGTFRVGFQLNGLKELLAGITIREERLVNALKSGVNNSAVVVEAKAKQIAPVRSGNLMRSIHTEFYVDGIRAIIGPDMDAAPYAYYVEFGRSKSGKTPPYPFAGRHYMETAFYQTKGLVFQILSDSVKQAIL